MSSSVRVRFDANVEGEITEFDDDGVPTLIINPLPPTVQSIAAWANAGLFDLIYWKNTVDGWSFTVKVG